MLGCLFQRELNSRLHESGNIIYIASQAVSCRKISEVKLGVENLSRAVEIVKKQLSCNGRL